MSSQEAGCLSMAFFWKLFKQLVTFQYKKNGNKRTVAHGSNARVKLLVAKKKCWTGINFGAFCGIPLQTIVATIIP